MRRIAVVGTTGSGKTALARELSRRLRIPCVEEDAILWGPNWTEAPRAERLDRITEALRGEAWVVDGNMLLWYALRTYRKRRDAYTALFARPEYAHLTVIQLRSAREVRAWLSTVSA